MRVLCFGSGALGSVLGAHLRLAGHEVGLLGRKPHMDAIEKSGIVFKNKDQEHYLDNISTFTDVSEVSSFKPDVVFLTVKSYDTAKAAREIQINMKNSLVVSFQNGIGNEDILADFLGDRVIAGTTTTSASFLEPGVISQNNSGGIGIAPFAGNKEAAIEVYELFLSTGLKSTYISSHESLKWSKLLLNINANALSAILDLSPQEIFLDLDLFGLEQQALREALKVMKKANIGLVDLPGFPVRVYVAIMGYLPPKLARKMLYDAMVGGRGNKMPSFWVDVDKGAKETEVSYLNGAIVKKGRELGIDTPVNQTLAEILTGMVHGRYERQDWRRRKDKLLKSI